MAIEFTLEPEYRYVIGACCLLALECVLVGFLAVGPARKKVFKAHEKEMIADLKEKNKDLDAGKFDATGYPDMGNGRYSEYLSYEEWTYFNRV